MSFKNSIMKLKYNTRIHCTSTKIDSMQVNSQISVCIRMLHEDTTPQHTITKTKQLSARNKHNTPTHKYKAITQTNKQHSLIT